MLINLFKLFLKLFKLLKFLGLFILSSPNFWENLRYEKKLKQGKTVKYQGCIISHLVILRLYSLTTSLIILFSLIHMGYIYITKVNVKQLIISSSSSGKQKKQGQIVYNYFTLNKKLSISLHCVLFNYVIFQIRNLIILLCISILIISRLKKIKLYHFPIF